MEIKAKEFYDLTNDELYSIYKARVDVFVVEQNCPYPDIDEIDKRSIHIFIEDNNEVLAYLRLFKKDDIAQIGRVLTTKRNKGYGSLILQEGLQKAKEVLGANKVYIEAQVYAIPFYEKSGFKVMSEEFLEDGIPHVKMICDL